MGGAGVGFRAVADGVGVALGVGLGLDVLRGVGVGVVLGVGVDAGEVRGVAVGLGVGVAAGVGRGVADGVVAGSGEGDGRTTMRSLACRNNSRFRRSSAEICAGKGKMRAGVAIPAARKEDCRAIISGSRNPAVQRMINNRRTGGR